DCMGQPQWAQNPRYRNRRAMLEEYPEEVDALLIPWLAQHTRAELFAMAREKRFPLAPGMTVPDMLGEEHLNARDFFDKLQVDDEVVRVPGLPSRFSTLRPERPSRAPVLGEHTAAI